MGVTVDTSALEHCLDGIEDALTRKGMRILAKEAERELRKGTAKGFRSGVEPSSGQRMYARKGTRGKLPGWPLLRDSGGLRRSLDQDSQLYGRKGQKMLLRSIVKDSRSGNESYHAIAGAQFFGRRDQRKYMKGRGKSRGKGGPMPGRRFAGVSEDSRRRLARRAQEIIGRFR